MGLVSQQALLKRQRKFSTRGPIQFDRHLEI